MLGLDAIGMGGVGMSATSSSTTTSVSADLVCSYSIGGSVSADLACSYTVLASVSADLACSYRVLSSVSADLAGSYTIRSAVSADLNCAYNIMAETSYTRAPVGQGYCGQIPVDPHTIRLLGEPAAAISLDAALAAARVDADSGLDDQVLTASVAYTEEAEGITQRAMVQQTWRASWTEFPPALRLPRPPLINVTSIKFYDDAGIQRTLDPQDYVIDADSEPAYVVPAPGRAWPVTSAHIHAVEVQYDCGYGPTEASVPKAIKLFVQAKLQQRFSPVATASQDSFDGLLDRYKVYA